ncbi:hypothetical protein MBLNU459_g1594t1 [Dothideomycetes sp. NU459]
MVLPRPTSLRGFAPARLLRSAAPRTANRALLRRGYASHGSHGSAPSSDLPWLVSAIAVTIPSCWYLWPEASHGEAHGAHGAHAEHAEHAEAKDEPEEEQPAEEEEAPKEEEEESKDEPKEEAADEKKDDEPKEESKDDESKDESKDEPKETKPDSEDKPTPENKGDTKDVQFKGPTTEGDDERKREPDSKGAFKKRIDSGAGKELGAGDAKREDGSESAATAKEPQKGKQGEITSKQFGLSTTATKHSTDIGNDPEKSKKGEGTPETAKAMGTVDVNRPQV